MAAKDSSKLLLFDVDGTLTASRKVFYFLNYIIYSFFLLIKIKIKITTLS